MAARKIRDARPVRPYLIEVQFADGRSATIDVESQLWGAAFEPLREPEFFAQGRFDPVGRTIVWPNGADFSPEFLAELALADSKATGDGGL